MKYGPAVGDVGVIGTIRYINRTPLGSWCLFDPNVTANGYASAAQNSEASLGVGCGSLSVDSVPDGLNNGDWVTADIVQGNFAAYAANLQPFSW
jgi:hypothetical protein